MKKKKRFLALLMAVAMLMPTTAAFAADTSDMMTTTNVSYTDVSKNAWYYEPVMKVSEMGLMSGVGDNKFQPERVLTRGQFATVLWNLEGHPAVEYTNLFDDVLKGEWYTVPAEWAGQTGMITGVDYRKFGVSNAITREQLVTMFYRYANMKGYDTSARADLSSFKDAYRIQPYAREAIQWGVAEGIINGWAGELTPINQVTRAQCATFIMNFLSYVERQTPKHEHTWDAGRVVVEPTCVTEGKMLFTCTDENCEDTREDIIPAFGHDLTTMVTDATCTEAGSKVTECSRCDFIEREEIPALGHGETELVNKKVATCTEDGYTGDDVCTRCETIVTRGNVVSKLGHNMVDDVEIVWNYWYECNACHKHFDNEDDVIRHEVVECGSRYSLKKESTEVVIGHYCDRDGCDYRN